jgi:uncharacterized protein YicC (UPF0701 family)
MARRLPPSLAGREDELRRLARQRITLGEIAARLQAPSTDVAAAVDALGLMVDRDERRGKARPLLAHQQSARVFIQQLRDERRVISEHQRRVASCPRLSPEQEREAIERFLRERGVTKCPAAYADGGTSIWVPPEPKAPSEDE